jgi:chemotaxis protein CheZ
MPSSHSSSARRASGGNASATRRGTVAARRDRPSSGERNLFTLMALADQAVSSLGGIISALDRTILHEFGAIAGSIVRAREEIGRLQTGELSRQHIPEAGRELAAIVEATEDATHRIMEAAERILEADDPDPDARRALVETEIMKIFEACAFQDITGQRVTRIVETLQEIEARVTRIARAVGADRTGFEPAAKSGRSAPRRTDELVNGPAPVGEGVAQEDVDALFE